jgi:putative ABC transport system ATP-binding protein
MSSGPLLALRDVSRGFRVGDELVHALDRISFDIDPGEYVSVIGPSGSGKSTLLQILGCLDTPSSGSYRIAGTEVSTLDDRALARVRNEKIGFVFQAFHLLPRTSVLENVLLPLSYRNGSTREHERMAREALELTCVAHRSQHWPNQLSGGERQRVAIARALVTRPPLLLCDEPTGNLDRRVSADIVEVFETLCEELRITLVLVTHDRELAQRAQRTLCIVDGSLVYDGDSHGNPLG